MIVVDVVVAAFDAANAADANAVRIDLQLLALLQQQQQ